jgi:hypothetical protein
VKRTSQDWKTTPGHHDAPPVSAAVSSDVLTQQICPLDTLAAIGLADLEEGLDERPDGRLLRRRVAKHSAPHLSPL